MSCVYKQLVGCEVCTHPYYRECKDFISARTAFITRGLRPFKMTTQHFKGPVVWSPDVNKAKSAAAQFAMKRNSEVKCLTLNQVMSLVLDSSDVEGSVFFVECTKKPYGDVEKVTSVLKSFIDKVVMSGNFISVLCSPASCVVLSDYPRL